MRLPIVEDWNMIFLKIIVFIGGGALMCSAFPGDLTDAEIHQYFRTTREAAPAYAIAELILPTGRTKRDVGELPLQMKIKGNMTTVHFKPTAGILADNRLPVWTAKGKANSSDVTYTRDQKAMGDIGDFTFYQDFEQKAAITLFHKDNSIAGGIGYMTIQYELPPVEGSSINARRYLLVSKKDLNISKSGGFINDWGDLHFDGNRQNGFPDAVYPEIMLVVDELYTEKTVAATVKKIIVEMNRVDMLYRGVKKPKIYLNLAAVVVPLDNNTTPWIQKGDPKNEGIVNDVTGVAQVGLHFEPYKKEFPDDDWDLLMSWISLPLREEGTHDNSREGGYTYSDVSCDRRWRKWRVSLMSITSSSFVAVAHEIAHFFNADHDDFIGCENPTGIMASFDEKQDHNLNWSKCTLKTLKEYFAKEKSTCMDNVPKTLIVPDDVNSTDPNTLCSELGLGTLSRPKIACNGYMYCYSDSTGELQFAPPEGTICNAPDQDEKVCYNGQCLFTNKSVKANDDKNKDEGKDNNVKKYDYGDIVIYINADQ